MLQEVAYRHAEERGWGWGALKPLNHFWVLVRVQMIFDRFPVWNDTIQLETWASGSNKLFAKRSWHFLDEQQQSIIRCNSDWAIIDGESRRIQRIRPESFAGWYLQEALLDKEPAKLSQLNKKIMAGKFAIRLSEIDLMQHVNNANYVKWAMDSLHLDFINAYEPAKIEVNFLKEAKYPATMLVFKEEIDALQTLFSITSEDETIEHVRILIHWRERR